MKIKNNDQSQLNLSLPNGVPLAECRDATRTRPQRSRRAGLWFAHMRRIVDQAGDWLPAPCSQRQESRSN